MSHHCEVIKRTPNPPQPELIPESLDAQLPSGTRLRFCFDEPLMTSEAGLLLLAEQANRSGDIERIASALAPRVKPPAPGERKPRAPEHSLQELITQRVMQIIGGYPDGNDSKPEVLAWLEAHGLRHVIGYSPNRVLEKQFARCITAARQRYARHVAEGRPEVEARTYACGSYSAGSWGGRQRRIVCRVIAGPHGIDARFVVTDLESLGAQKLYEVIYCGRGRAELYIKDHKPGLTSDRLSCTRKEGNAMRLLMSSLAYQVLDGFRRQVLAGSDLARATFGEIRLKLFKLAARVRVMKTRVEVHLAQRHPGSQRLAQVLAQAMRVTGVRPASG